MFLETCISLLTVGEKASKLYDWFTGINSGEKKNALVNDLEKNKMKVVKLSDRLLYSPEYQQVINKQSPVKLFDTKEVYNLLNPVAEALQMDMLASAVISTPDKLRSVFKKDPWELLVDIRPADRTKKPNNPDMIPIAFIDDHKQYIGWQTRGALPILFNCDFESNGSLWLPKNQEIVEENQILELPAKSIQKYSKNVIEGSKTKTNQPQVKDFEKELAFFFKPQKSKNSFFFGSDISEKVRRNCYSSFRIPYSEIIYAVYDCTVFGSAKDGVAFASNAIYFHNSWSAAKSGAYYLPYEKMMDRTFELSADCYEVTIGHGYSISVLGSKEDKNRLVDLLTCVKNIAIKYWRI
jgi:hypothetical protein